MMSNTELRGPILARSTSDHHHLAHMAAVSHLPVMALFLCALLISACQVNIPVEPSAPPATSTPPSTNLPMPSPTPNFNLSVMDSTWIESQETLEWHFIGIIQNDEDFTLTDLSVSLDLENSVDSSGLIPASVELVPSTLSPGKQGVFSFNSAQPFDVLEQQISPMAKRADDVFDLDLNVNLLSERDRIEGGQALIGEVLNNGDHLLQLRQVVLVTFDASGELSGLATSDHIFPILSPGGNSFFQASYIGSQDPLLTWTAFVDAEAALLPSPPPLALKDTPVRLNTAQGQGYFLTEIQNQGVTAWISVIQIEYRFENELISLDTLQLPFPILPGEKTAILIDPTSTVPPAFLKPDQTSNLEVNLKIDPWRSLPTLADRISLPIRIDKFEQISSRLFLEGTLTNPLTTPVFEATAYVRLLDSRGNIRSVSWSGTIEVIQPEQSHQFDLSLILPSEISLSLVEYDVQGFAFTDHMPEP